MNTKLLNVLGAAIEAGLKDPQTLIDADRMYSAKYRTNDIVGSDLGGDDTHSAVEILCAELAAKDGLYRPEYRFDDESNEYEHEMYWEQVEQYKPQATEMIAQGVQFVMLVNYKGEFEGYASTQAAASLKLFVSKFNYR